MLRYTLVALLAAAAHAASLDKFNGYVQPNGDEDSGEDGGEYGNKFEGDMILAPQQQAYLNYDGSQNRNGLRNPTYRWPAKTVVYEIQQNVFNDDQKNRINAAMEDIAKNTCIRFRKRRTQEEHAVVIKGDGSGCYAHVGFTGSRRPGNQTLHLARGCFSHGTIVHEMLHTLGFFHMQSASNRDDYVRIQWENIQSGHEHNFNKYNNKQVTDFGVEYDYQSVMHYGATAFSSNGQPTIVALKDNVTLGQRSGMTKSDILKLNRMYCQ